MIANIVDYLKMFAPEIRTFIISTLPIVELRGAIPVSIAMGIPMYNSLILCFLGSMLPLPFLLYGIRPIFKILSRVSMLEKLITHLSIRSIRKSKVISRYGLSGLIIFVAMPLPGTGVWSGALIATLLDIRIRRSMLAIAIGNFIAAIIVTFLSTGIIDLFS